MSPSRIDRAAEVLLGGGLVVFPTETVWGLGANALDVTACRRIFEAKGRPQDNPLIVHVASHEAIYRVASFVSEAEEALIRAFMPGPLTLIVSRSADIDPEISGGRRDVGIRIPELPLARAFLQACGVPVAAPSANRSGRPSPTNLEMAKDAMMGRADAILDGPACRLGLESTVVRIRDETLEVLRPGSITFERIAEVCPTLKPIMVSHASEVSAPTAPGTKYAHYRPRARVLLTSDRDGFWSSVGACTHHEKIGVIWPRSDQDHGAFPLPLPPGCEHREYESLEHYARCLFAWFHELDREGVTTIIAHLPDDDGLGRALRNRLTKAAEPRRR